MGSRTRSRTVRQDFHEGGNASHIAGVLAPVYPANMPYLVETMVDFTGNFAFTNPLDLTQRDRVLGWVTGPNGGSNAWLCKRYIVVDSGRANAPNELSDSVAATKALAMTNPQRPVVDVWNFLFELKDIPQMILQIGRFAKKYGLPAKNWPKGLTFSGVSRDVGDAYLGWTFGWDLLAKDLIAMLDSAMSIDKRVHDLEALKAGELRKSATLFTGKFPLLVQTYVGPLYSATSYLQFNLEYDDKIWARVRYKPSAFTLHAIGNDTLSTARSLAYGHVPSIATIWNAIPWTWLIDYFSTIGDYLNATRNNLQVIVDDIAVMKHQTIQFQNPDSWGKQLSGAPILFEVNKHYVQSYKYRRKVSGPSAQFYIPFLNGKQLSILAALGTRFL